MAPATTVATPVASPATRRRRGPATIPATDAWNTATAVAAPVTRPCHASRTCAPRPRRLSTTDEVRLMAAICFAALVGAAMLALLEGALG